MILVDAPRRYGTTVWAHMVSDKSEAELHRMAAVLGLHRRWFRPGRHPHYDLRLSKWRQALHQGVRCVTTRELVASTDSEAEALAVFAKHRDALAEEGE